jgi:quercetin dioxygenase-like cupin family protein
VNIQTYDGPICSTAIAEGLYVRRMFFEKRGDRNDGHAHTYDHVTCLAAGAVRCTVDGVVEDFKAPHLFVTPKDAYHRFEALEAGTVLLCMHALRDTDRTIVPADTPIEEAAPLVGQLCLRL